MLPVREPVSDRSSDGAQSLLKVMQVTRAALTPQTPPHAPRRRWAGRPACSQMQPGSRACPSSGARPSCGAAPASLTSRRWTLAGSTHEPPQAPCFGPHHWTAAFGRLQGRCRRRGAGRKRQNVRVHMQIRPANAPTSSCTPTVCSAGRMLSAVWCTEIGLQPVMAQDVLEAVATPAARVHARVCVFLVRRSQRSLSWRWALRVGCRTVGRRTAWPTQRQLARRRCRVQLAARRAHAQRRCRMAMPSYGWFRSDTGCTDPA